MVPTDATPRNDAPHSGNEPPRRAEMPPKGYARRWGTVVFDKRPTQKAERSSAHSSLASPSEAKTKTILPAPSVRTSIVKPSQPALPATPQPDAPYRVLIVEDDRSQALFAQSVLNGASIQARVEISASAVSQSIQEYQPDLILMDLHMPELDGIRLTALIRQQPGRNLLPIVFLTGDPDPEKEFELLESGADDVLTKPIRPRHLIAAVSNRIRRIRQQTLQSGGDSARKTQNNPETGLLTSEYLLQILQQRIQQHSKDALFLIEISNTLSLHERYGLAAFERLMHQVALRLSSAARPHLLARQSDNRFLLLVQDSHSSQLEEIATQLRVQLHSQPFSVHEEESINLRCAIGYSETGNKFKNLTEAMHTVEQATIHARLHHDKIAASSTLTSAEKSLTQQSQTFEDCQLELAYQPIVAVNGPRTAQYQVLLRMRKPDGVLLPANKIIDVAEASGRMIDFDQQVMEHSLSLLDLHKETPTGLRLFVSQSAQTLLRKDVTEWLLISLKERSIEGSNLTIDIRLNEALTCSKELQQVAMQLSPHGISLCLNQFDKDPPEAMGLLADLPLDYVRLSQRYCDVHMSISLRDELQELIEKVHGQGLQIIAQQIEDAQAAATMWISGVDFIQGNLVRSVGTELDFNFDNTVI